MKKIILIGNVACGKTTICQYLNHMEIKYKKTQALEVYNTTIDTPGEYLENRGYLRSLMVTATETDQVVFVQDASRDQFFFSPGQSSAFTLPVAGVVTKIDIATPKQIADLSARFSTTFFPERFSMEAARVMMFFFSKMP